VETQLLGVYYCLHCRVFIPVYSVLLIISFDVRSLYTDVVYFVFASVSCGTTVECFYRNTQNVIIANEFPTELFHRVLTNRAPLKY